MVAFRTAETTHDLNGDGDLEDLVMQVVDLADDSLVSTGFAARICDLPACEPFFEPYRIQGRVLSFLTHESEQSGPPTGRQPDGSIGGIGCLATSLPGECDLNGDGDADDLVMQVYSLESQATQAFELDEESPPLDANPFPGSSALLADGGPTIVSLEVDEAIRGEDLDGDGALGVVVLIVGDSDGDGTLNNSDTRDDNCVEAANADQADDDVDRLGNVCDIAVAQLPELACDAAVPMGLVDIADIDQISADFGMTVTGPDARDPDEDGVVTELDLDLCLDACETPECSGLVLLDIRPWAPLNRVNLKSQGVLPVAILGEPGFDVSTVDRATLRFGPGAAAPVHALGHIEDVSLDGISDLVLHFQVQETGLAAGDQEACVVGVTLRGTEFSGCDAVIILRGCGLGFELALVLPALAWLRTRRRRVAPSSPPRSPERKSREPIRFQGAW